MDYNDRYDLMQIMIVELAHSDKEGFEKLVKYLIDEDICDAVELKQLMKTIADDKTARSACKAINIARQGDYATTTTKSGRN